MNTFQLTILTPEHEFFNGMVEALTITSIDGERTILASHAPMVTVLEIGVLKIKQNGIWKEATHSEGFLEVAKQEVSLFVQACEYPENIDVKRVEAAKAQAEEMIRQKQSLMEYGGSKIALARAMARLSAVKHKLD